MTLRLTTLLPLNCASVFFFFVFFSFSFSLPMDFNVYFTLCNTLIFVPLSLTLSLWFFFCHISINHISFSQHPNPPLPSAHHATPSAVNRPPPSTSPRIAHLHCTLEIIETHLVRALFACTQFHLFSVEPSRVASEAV